jgi:uncharacterized protein YeaO (DUF488 family)
MSKCVENIHTKRVYDPPDQADGPRVLVDRLWPRGLRKESIALTLWLKEIAPSPELRRWFGHDPARWRSSAGATALNWRSMMRLSYGSLIY